MSKKVKAEKSSEPVKIKKKGSCGKKCACCFTTILLIIVLLFGGLFAAAAILYNQYLEPTTKVGFFPALDAIFSLYGGKENKIVTNPYSKADLDSFYSDLKHAMFISQDTQIDIGTLLEGALTPPEGENGSGSGGAAESGSTGNSGFDAFLDSLNFDFSTLKDYQGSEWILEITDKQAGAVANEVMHTMLKDPQMAAMTSCLSVKQVIINNADGTDPELCVTAGLSVENLIKTYLEEAGAKDWGNFAAFFLPKNLYFTLYVYPQSDTAMRYVVNDYSNEKMENLKGLINGIMQMMDTSANQTPEGESTQQPSLDSIFGEFDVQFKEMFANLNDSLGITFVDSKLKMKPVKTLLGILGIEENVSERELLMMMKHIVSADMPTLDDIYDSKWSDSDAQSFIENLQRAYAVESGLLTVDNFFTEIANVADHIDISALDLTVPAQQMKVGLTYKALAALVQKHVDSNMGETETGGFQIKIASITSYEADGKRYLRISVKTDLQSYLDSKLGADVPKAAKNLVGALMPPYIYLSADIDLSAGGSGENLNFNGVGVQNTKELLATLGKVVASIADESAAQELSAEKLLATVGDAIQKALSQMEGEGSVKIEFGEQAVMFPSVYDSIKNFYNMTELDSDELRLSLYGLLDPAQFEREALINPSTTTPPSFGSLPITLTDKALGYLLNSGIHSVEGDLGYQEGDLSISQTLLCDLTLANSSILKQNPVFADHLSKISGKRMLLTLKVNLQSVTGSQMDNLLPSYVYATVVMGVEAQTSTFLFLNGLSESRSQIIRDLIFNITGEDKLNLASIMQNVESYAKNKEIVTGVTVGDMLEAGTWKMRDQVDEGGEGLGYIEYAPLTPNI